MQQMMEAQEQLHATVPRASPGWCGHHHRQRGHGFEHVRHRPGRDRPRDDPSCSPTSCSPRRDLTNQVQDLQRGSIGGLDLGDVNLGAWAGGAFGDPELAGGVYAGPVQDLIDELGRLPGSGPSRPSASPSTSSKLPKEDACPPRPPSSRPRSGWRSAHLLQHRRGHRVRHLRRPRRDATVLQCVVEEPRDLVAVERTGEFPRPATTLQGRHQPHRGHRPRAAGGVQGAAARLGDGVVKEVIPLHQPEHRGRGHRHVPLAAPDPDGAST